MRKEANQYLRRTFLPNYSRLFGVAAANVCNAWLKVGPLDNPNVCCLRDTRTLRNDLTISAEASGGKSKVACGPASASYSARAWTAASTFMRRIRSLPITGFSDGFQRRRTDVWGFAWGVVEAPGTPGALPAWIGHFYT